MLSDMRTTISTNCMTQIILVVIQLLLIFTTSSQAMESNKEESSSHCMCLHPNQDGSTPSSNTITIGIAGGTGAGKTTLAQAVYRELGKEQNIAYLTHDNYYKDISHLSQEQRSKTNFDHPDSLDTELLIQHVQTLKLGKSVNVPIYDFTTHSRTESVLVVHPKPIILVEGILIFSEELLVELLDLKVFVDADSDVRLMRRINRDVAERGRSIESVMDQYTTTVRPMHEMFVEPSKRVADIIVHDAINPVVLKMICNYLISDVGISSSTSSSSREEEECSTTATTHKESI